MRDAEQLERVRLEPHPDLFLALPNGGLKDGLAGLEVPADRTVLAVLKPGPGAAGEQHGFAADQKDVRDDRQGEAGRETSLTASSVRGSVLKG